MPLCVCVCVCVREREREREREICCSVANLCSTLFNPMDYSSPGSSVHRIL